MPTSVAIEKVYHSRRLLAESCHRRAYRLRVYAAHDLADVLFLAAQRTVRLDSARIQHRFEQVVVEPDLPKVRFL